MVDLANALSTNQIWFLSNSDRLTGDQISARLMQAGVKGISQTHTLSALDFARDWVSAQRGSGVSEGVRKFVCGSDLEGVSPIMTTVSPKKSHDSVRVNEISEKLMENPIPT